MSAKKNTSAQANAPGGARRHEILGVFAATIGLLLAIAIFSYSESAEENLAGALGNAIAWFFLQAFGAAALLFTFEFALLARRLILGRPNLLGPATFASTLVIAFAVTAGTQIVAPEAAIFGGLAASGVVGQILGEVLRDVLGTYGSSLVLVAIVLITLILRTPLSLFELVEKTSAFLRRVQLEIAHFARSFSEALREAIALELTPAASSSESPRIVTTASGELRAPEFERKRFSARDSTESSAAKAEELGDDGTEDEFDGAEILEFTPRNEGSSKRTARPPQGELKRTSGGPTIVSPQKTQLEINPSDVETSRGTFEFPSTELLQCGERHSIPIDPEVLRANADRLTETLADYGVKGRVDEIHPGPVVTMYEFEPQSGTKVSKIAGLADDIAMSLAAQRVRIVAPIPGKARVGFELPNDHRATVYLRTVLEDKRWQKHDGALPIALGQDITGQPVYADLAKMPHLLVAGATGAGKSVGLNVMLTSLLYKRTPDEVRLLMIDPKVVELKVYDDIPHMLLPVVTDMNKAALALRWAVDEMERRYQLFADAGTRDIKSYNKKVERVEAGELELEKLVPGRVGKVRAQGPDGEELYLDPSDGEEADAPEIPPKLPYIVVVVDEFADLMMVSAKDVEACIARLAQKARAAGIHVILATQRPSVDVITGMIKANFPARIAYKVSQREDSKTILTRQGAEHLLGMGDMLYLAPGTSDLLRVHSAFISEDEVHAVCDHLRTQGTPVYDENITRPRDEDNEGMGLISNEDLPLYDRAVQIVAEAGSCSISQLQRHLSIGYNRAAKLVEQMEKEGVVGPPPTKAGGRREVLISPS